MLSDNDLTRVQEVSRNIKRPVTLFVNLAGNQDVVENNFANIARQLQGVSLDRIRIEEGGVTPFPGKPSMVLSNGEYSNINYMAFPEGPQFGPFLDAIAWIGAAAETAAFSKKEKIKELRFPNNVFTFVATGCPHCPEAVRSVLIVACSNPQINVSIIDALFFPDISEKYKIKSTPAIIINDGMTIVGGIKPDELAEYLIGVNDGASLTVILKSMILSGRAEDAAGLVCEKERADALLPIYISPEFSQRMGALLVMEEALDRNPSVLDPIVDRLIELLQSDDVGLRGDTASMLGRIGSRSAIPALKKVAEDPNADVRDAALEALENFHECI